MTDTVTIPADEYAALKRDAERYRWLRKAGKSNRVPHIAQYPFAAGVDKVEYPHFCKVGIDAAIDAAMLLTRWPWGPRWWKPSPGGTPADHIRELVKAGALIVAEIERLQRADTLKETSHEAE